MSLSTNPFNLYTSTFSQATYENATLYVPQGTVDIYKEKGGWKEFCNIEDSLPNSITHPTNRSSEATEIERYTLDGKQIAKPQRGLNVIRMSDGSTRKVYVK